MNFQVPRVDISCREAVGLPRWHGSKILLPMQGIRDGSSALVSEVGRIPGQPVRQAAGGIQDKESGVLVMRI